MTADINDTYSDRSTHNASMNKISRKLVRQFPRKIKKREKKFSLRIIADFQPQPDDGRNITSIMGLSIIKSIIMSNLNEFSSTVIEKFKIEN